MKYIQLYNDNVLSTKVFEGIADTIDLQINTEK